MFWIAQIIGLIALIILVISFQINNKRKLLKLQIFSSMFFALQYLLLNAYSGVLMSIIVMLRNYLFQKKVSIKKLIMIISLMLLASIFTFNGIVSILPIIACIEYSIALWQSKLKILRIAEIISCILYLIYNLCVFAYMGVISTIIEFIFAIIAICRFDFKKGN